MEVRETCGAEVTCTWGHSVQRPDRQTLTMHDSGQPEPNNRSRGGNGIVNTKAKAATGLLAQRTYAAAGWLWEAYLTFGPPP